MGLKVAMGITRDRRGVDCGGTSFGERERLGDDFDTILTFLEGAILGERYKRRSLWDHGSVKRGGGNYMSSKKHLVLCVSGSESLASLGPERLSLDVCSG